MNKESYKSIKALRGKVLVHNIEQGERRTKAGLIVLDDDGKERGIRERWAQVYAIGPDVDDVSVGQWILIKHGRWSRGVDITVTDTPLTVRQVDYPEAILLVSDNNPLDP
jgi:hypothetical protein